ATGWPLWAGAPVVEVGEVGVPFGVAEVASGDGAGDRLPMVRVDVPQHGGVGLASCEQGARIVCADRVADAVVEQLIVFSLLVLVAGDVLDGERHADRLQGLCVV